MTIKVAALHAPGGLDRLAIATRDAPAAGPGEIVVRVRASSLNYHDLAVVQGRIPVADGRIPMSDGAGEVAAVGEGVAEWAVGDRVMSLFHPRWRAGGATAERLGGVPGEQADGFAAEMVAVRADAVTRSPAGWTDAEAATLPCAGLTAWRALFVEAGVRPGDTVLTQGTGGVSLFAVQFAKAAGARVIATSSTPERMARLTALGADHVVSYRATPDWGRAVMELTGGCGVDAVVDVGGAGTLAQSLTAVRVGGHVSLIGVLGGWQGELILPLATLKNVRLQGFSVGSAHEQTRMVAALEAGGIRPVIDSTWPLDDIVGAFRHHERQAHVGKICLAL